MGGHGGLNILPQKSWNVYNYENREKVRKDEEAAAKEEQLKREQSLRRDSEFRIEKLRQARGLASSAPRHSSSPPSSPTQTAEADSGHINLFQGLVGFTSLIGGGNSEEKEDDGKKGKKEERSGKRKREEKPVVVLPEDEKYRLGYGVAGKGVKSPWYLSRTSQLSESGDENGGRGVDEDRKEKKKVAGKKTIEELREERMKREKREKERERVLMASASRQRNTSSFEGSRVRGSRFS